MPLSPSGVTGSVGKTTTKDLLAQLLTPSGAQERVYLGYLFVEPEVGPVVVSQGGPRRRTASSGGP